MGVLQRFERRLGGLVEGIFARAFKSEVQPVEVAAALQRELDDQAAVVARDRTLVPNASRSTSAITTTSGCRRMRSPSAKELAAMVREHAEEQGYSFVGAVEIELASSPASRLGCSAFTATSSQGRRSRRSIFRGCLPKATGAASRASSTRGHRRPPRAAVTGGSSSARAKTPATRSHSGSRSPSSGAAPRRTSGSPITRRRVGTPRSRLGRRRLGERPELDQRHAAQRRARSRRPRWSTATSCGWARRC